MRSQIQSGAISNPFVLGRDTLTQRQAIKLLTDHEWTFSAGAAGQAKMRRAGHEPVILPTGAYTTEQSREIFKNVDAGSVAPTLTTPTGLEFAVLMDAYRRLPASDFPRVSVGSFGPLMPQIRPARQGAPTPAQIDDSMRGVTDKILDDHDPRSDWRPSTRIGLCMWASAARHLELMSSVEIAEKVLRLGTIQRVDAIVLRGDAYWSSLGAWPWAGLGDMPSNWWLLPAAREALEDAHRHYMAGLNRRLARGQTFGSFL